MSKDKPNLHDIDHRIRTIMEEGFDPATGEVAENDSDMLDLLADLDMTRKEKILHCMKYRDEHEMMAANIKVLEARLAKRKKAHQRKADWLKGWVEESGSKDETFESADMVVSFRESKRIEIRDFDAVPKALLVTKVSSAVDKVAVKAWIEKHNGESPAGIDQVTALNVQVK
jgi:BMFP domain-containing protein YqiC